MEIQNATTLLFVYDMRRSVAFYRDILGFAVVQTWEPDGHLYWAMLKHGGALLMLNADYEDDQRPPEPPKPPVHKLTLYFTCGDVDGAYAELDAKGCNVDPPVVTRYGMREVYTTDPDGFRVCLQQPAG